MVCTSWTSPVCLVYLVRFVYLVDLVYLVSFLQPKNQTNQINETDETNQTGRLASLTTAIISPTVSASNPHKLGIPSSEGIGIDLYSVYLIP